MITFHRKRRGRRHMTDPQEDAVAVTVEDFESDGVQTRASKRKRGIVTTEPESNDKESESDSENDSEDDSDKGSNKENEHDELESEGEQEKEEDSPDAPEQYRGTPQCDSLSLDSFDEENPQHTNDEETSQHTNDQVTPLTNNGRPIIPSPAKAEEDAIQAFKRFFPEDNSYLISRDRDMLGSGTRQRKAREPWNAFETFTIEMGLGLFQDSKWADIKKLYPTIFSNRTAVQIKDRARTELKRRQKENEPLGSFAHIIKERNT